MPCSINSCLQLIVRGKLVENTGARYYRRTITVSPLPQKCDHQRLWDTSTEKTVDILAHMYEVSALQTDGRPKLKTRGAMSTLLYSILLAFALCGESG